MPVGVVAVATVLLLFMWTRPTDETTLESQVVVTLLVAVPGSLLLGTWWFCFSRFSWWVRLLVPISVVAGIVGVASQIRRFEISGDYVPIVEFKWSEPREARLTAHRDRLRAQGAKASCHGIAPSGESSTEFGPEDFPEYRGRARDGVVHGPPLSQDWTSHPPRLLWRQPVGGGCAGVVVVANSVITCEQRGANEAIACYDKQSGLECWVHQYPALFNSTAGEGPRATPTVFRGNVYAFGATGKLTCVEGQTGTLRWSVDVVPLDARAYLDHGLTCSPLAHGELVIVTPGVAKGASDSRGVLAYDATSGHPVWNAGSRSGSYASPMIVALAGQPQLLVLDAVGLVGYELSTGQELWHFDWADREGSEFNITQPIVLPGDRVFVSCGMGSVMVQVAKADQSWTAQEIWRSRDLQAIYSNPVAYGEYLYGLSRGILTCIDARTGQRCWKAGRYRHGQLLLCGEQLVIQSETGDLALVEASPVNYRLVTSFHAIDGIKSWNNPAMSGGLIVLRNNLEMACYDLRAARVPAAP